MAFGLTNPKSYPVALAMFSAIVAPIGRFADAPQMFAAAFLGFLLAERLIFAAGLPAVRKFFLTHGVAVTRIVGVIFILFGARSIATPRPARCGGRREASLTSMMNPARPASTTTGGPQKCFGDE